MDSELLFFPDLYQIQHLVNFYYGQTNKEKERHNSEWSQTLSIDYQPSL
jgi:hypothetical protein